MILEYLYLSVRVFKKKILICLNTSLYNGKKFGYIHIILSFFTLFVCKNQYSPKSGLHILVSCMLSITLQTLMYLALSRLSSFLVCGHHLTSLTQYVFQKIDHWTDTFMICISTYQFLKCVNNIRLGSYRSQGWFTYGEQYR